MRSLIVLVTYKKLKNLYNRWDIPDGEQEKFDRFKNRVFHCLDTYVGRLFLDKPTLETKLLLCIGEFSGTSYSTKTTHIPGLIDGPPGLYGKDITDYFHQTRIGNLILNLDYLTDFQILVLTIQCVFWLEELDDKRKEMFFQCIKKAIESSDIQLSIRKGSKGEFIIVPKGARPLDEKLVDDVLEWLTAYPEAKKHFERALAMLISRDYREAADNMRLSFENFLKQFFPQQDGRPQRKGLEKFPSDVKAYLQQKKVPNQVLQSYNSLFHHYGEYLNFIAKHKDDRGSPIAAPEAEYIVYLTGLLIRLLIQLEQ